MATIALARYKARKHPKRGSVMTNPGGPGVPGRMLGSKGGKFFHDMLGADWDIIGFDPRGIGETTCVTTSCFLFHPPDTAHMHQTQDTMLPRPFVSPPLPCKHGLRARVHGPKRRQHLGSYQPCGARRATAPVASSQTSASGAVQGAYGRRRFAVHGYRNRRSRHGLHDKNSGWRRC